MKKTLKLFTVAAMFALLLSAATVFAASSPKTVVTKFFKAAKKYSVTGMAKTISYESSFPKINEPFDTVVRKMNKNHLKYTIKSTKKTGTKATVKVKCTYYDGYSAFKYGINKMIAYANKNSGADRETLVKKIVSYSDSFYKKSKKSKYTKKATMTFTLQKYSDGWAIISTSGNFNAIINGNYQKAYSAIFE